MRGAFRFTGAFMIAYDVSGRADPPSIPPLLARGVYPFRYGVIQSGHGGVAVERGQDMTRKVVVRVDDALYEALARDAKQNERTISQTVRHKLRELVA